MSLNRNISLIHILFTKDMNMYYYNQTGNVFKKNETKIKSGLDIHFFVTISYYKNQVQFIKTKKIITLPQKIKKTFFENYIKKTKK